MSDNFIDIMGLRDGINNILERLDGVAKTFADQQIMNRLGLTGVRYIKKRTREGRDIHGNTFKPYSAQHAERRRALNLPIDIVNLQMNDIDGMMNSVDYEVGDKFDSVTIGITRSEKEELMRIHSIIGAGRGKVRREAWGFTVQEQDRLLQTFMEDYKKLLIKELEE